jgi:hypothetical protein
VEAGQLEVSLVIGIIACGTSACPAPSADLGEIIFVGKYQSQGEVGNTLNSFENFTFVVPSDISGKASIQVQHIFVLTPPVSLFCCSKLFLIMLFTLLKRAMLSLASSIPVSGYRSLQALPRAPALTYTPTAITVNV